MIRPLFGWGLLTLLAYLFFLLLTLPAQHVVAWSKLPMTEVRGSLWAGSGTLRAGGEVIPNVRWRLHPIWPWQGALGAQVEAEHQGWQAAGALHLAWNGSLRVQDATVSGPLDSPLLTRHTPLPLQGQVRLHIPRADWQHGLAQAEGVTLEVLNPRLLLGEPLALGDLDAKIEVTDGRLDGRLHDRGGPLELKGRLEGDARTGIVFEANLKPRPGAPAALAANLRLLPTAPEGGAHLQTRLGAAWLATPQQAP